MRKNLSGMLCMLCLFMLLLPAVSAMNEEKAKPRELTSPSISINSMKIDDNAYLVFNITNTGNETINMSAIFIKLQGGIPFFKTNVSTFVYLGNIAPGETQTLQTEHPVARVSLLLKRPALLGKYSFDFRYGGIHTTNILLIIFKIIRLQ